MSKKGWRLVIPGRRPIATPAYYGGMLFVGGGYGSYEFYALDALTGKPIWIFKTGDDGREEVDGGSSYESTCM